MKHDIESHHSNLTPDNEGAGSIPALMLMGFILLIVEIKLIAPRIDDSTKKSLKLKILTNAAIPQF